MHYVLFDVSFSVIDMGCAVATVVAGSLHDLRVDGVGSAEEVYLLLGILGRGGVLCALRMVH